MSVAVALLALSACSESTVIRTDPDGATVWVNEHNLGPSPVTFKAKSWSVRPKAYRYRVERAGYLPSEGYLPARLSIRRIISAYMSSCLSCARGFYELDDDTNIVLVHDPTAFGMLSMREKVEELSRRYDARLIDAAELHRLRIELLNEPGKDPVNERQ